MAVWSTATGKLEQAAALDPVANGLEKVISTVLPRGRVKDLLHGTWLGHQLHPLLVAVPIGLWSGVSLLDLTAAKDKGARRAAQRLVGAGVLAALPAAASGAADYSELGAFQRPKRVGAVHSAANNLTLVLYTASWLARRKGNQARGARLALAGAATMSVGGYLGGHLAYAEGVGVNRNADLPKEPTDWTDVDLDPTTVLEGDMKRVEVAGQQVLLARTANGLQAIGAVCGHYGAPLEQGELKAGGDACVVCPWHASEFRMRDGKVVHGPATSPQPSYEVRTPAAGKLQLRIRA